MLILEHKTTSDEIGPGSTYWKRLTLDPQVSVYLDAVGAAMMEWSDFERDEVGGVLYDVLRKPAHRPAKGDKSPDDFELRCVEAICAEPDRYFQRGKIVRLAREVWEAQADLWQTAEQIRHAQIKGRWPRNPDACVTYGRTCDYWPVCSGERDIHDALSYANKEARAQTKSGLPLLSQSSVRAFRSCPRRYYYEQELRREPRIAADALRVGRVIHKALEVWWQTRGDVDAAVGELVPMRASDPWGEAKARAMVRCYHARWESDLPRWGAVVVEREFAVPLVNPDTGAKSRTWQVGGRVDGLVFEAREVEQMKEATL